MFRSEALEEFENSFRQATHLWVKLAPNPPEGTHVLSAAACTPACALVSSTPRGTAYCVKMELAACRRAGATRSMCQQRCFARIAIAAAPVLVGGTHVATLLAGHVLRRLPDDATLASVGRRLNRWGAAVRLAEVQRAYEATPRITGKEWRGAVKLLELFADHLAEQAAHGLLRPAGSPPSWLDAAQHFVRQHHDERITMRDAARQVNLSRYHFCKMFRRFTGQTFTEYITRVRLQKAKELLRSSQLRVVEVVDLAGFGSVPQFNSVFRRYVGRSPTAYRRDLASATPGSPAPSPPRSSRPPRNLREGIPNRRVAPAPGGGRK
ncbi:MAG TPA: helix-turn-helix domain-containing protein [Candidatus Eisenbacteria bacterium]|nr:helix-turn-helix domain-containing protein [Candidatus Eisenbacteria bacterium]